MFLHICAPIIPYMGIQNIEKRENVKTLSAHILASF
jgi:hypothetical protein